MNSYLQEAFIKNKPEISKETLKHVAGMFLIFVPSIIVAAIIGMGLMLFGYSIWLATPLALAAFAVALGYSRCVSDLTDFLVPCLVVMAIALIMLPVTSRSVENQRKRRERLEQPLKLQKTANPVTSVQ